MRELRRFLCYEKSGQDLHFLGSFFSVDICSSFRSLLVLILAPSASSSSSSSSSSSFFVVVLLPLSILLLLSLLYSIFHFFCLAITHLVFFLLCLFILSIFTIIYYLSISSIVNIRAFKQRAREGQREPYKTMEYNKLIRECNQLPIFPPLYL